MLVKIIKNFLFDEEVCELNKWALNNYHGPFFVPPKEMDSGYAKYRPTRLTTRGFGLTNAPLQYPNGAYQIQKKIKDLFEIEDCLYPPPYFDGIVCGVGLRGGYIDTHIDPIFYDGTETVHCIFKTQKPDSGGNTIIEDLELNEIAERDMLVCVVSKQKHGASRIVGNKPRVLWYYGFCLDALKINQIFC